MQIRKGDKRRKAMNPAPFPAETGMPAHGTEKCRQQAPVVPQKIFRPRLTNKRGYDTITPLKRGVLYDQSESRAAGFK